MASDVKGAGRRSGVFRFVEIGVLVACLIGASAQAKEVKFPADHPTVMMEVPDDWSTAATDQGLELLSPEKNSIIVLQVVPHSKAAMQAWAEKTGDRLRTFGVVFRTDGKLSNPKAAEVKAPAAPESALAPPTGLNTAGLAANPDGFSFSGAPTVAGPASGSPSALASLGGTSLDPLNSSAATPHKAKLPMEGMGYAGTTRQGKPVDTELVILSLPSKQVLLMMQESDPDDNRSVAIANSVALAK